MGVSPLYSILITRDIVAPAGSGCPLYSRLTKTTAKKPCFSKSGDAASILYAIDCRKGDFRIKIVWNTYEGLSRVVVIVVLVFSAKDKVIAL
nr:hypothetical protein [uncultured Flavobacterium sp.]